MPTTTHLSVPRATSPAALERLQPVGPSHDDVRRYSRARRNVLPRADHVTAVTGGWAHDVVLRSDAPVEVALWCPGDRPYPGLEATAARVTARAMRAHRISERVLARIQPEATAPALLSVVRLPRCEPARVVTGSALLVLVADGIEYAGNLGSLVRTADACAADALVLTRATARVTHPKVFAASRGTVLTTPVLTYATVAEAQAGLADAGFTTYVADPAGAMPYRSAGLGAGRTAVVVGSEGEGVSDEWGAGLTRVSIPMRGRADSLNVAASAAVLLFEARAALDEGDLG
ncbi:TrmH family RNA methyltransferase [Nocardioides sp.]|jgi:TrmH family RNA methyltransferase|uniref:TrmH family RNA methyltransferase n=1 Tax=Nocardioides sp. TaxID=35761 RepID=UPI002F3F9DFC